MMMHVVMIMIVISVVIELLFIETRVITERSNVTHVSGIRQTYRVRVKCDKLDGF